MRVRIGGGLLLAIVAVGISAWLSDDSDQAGWLNVLTVATAGSILVFAPTYVDWLRSRARLRGEAAALGERELPEERAGLLRPERHVVPFQGRKQESAELREWCRDDKPPVRLLVGAGGVGKTRLALELGEYLRSCGWRVVLVGAGKEAEALSLLEATTRGSIFLVVDYAETRAGLVELLRSVPDHSAHVRVLLVARSAGDWWSRLCADVPPVRKLLDEYPPIELTAELDVPADLTELVRAAVPHFARALGVPAPRHVDVSVPAGVPLLVLHATALVAVLRSQLPAERAPAEPLVADHEVLRELLGHEQRYWKHSAEQAGLGHLSPVVLKRAVAVSCLFPAEDETDAARMLRRVPDLRDDERMRRHVARWLRELYPADIGFWGLLQPELVAETHVMEQVRDCPELVTERSPEPRPKQARHMLTVLSHGAAWRLADRVLLERALRADLEHLLPAALEAATASGGALRTVLIRVLVTADLTPETLRDIDQAIPHPTTALAGAAVVVVRRILNGLPPDSSRSETAHWRERLAVMEAQAGRPATALRDIRKAVDHYRALVAVDRRRFLPDLARCLHILGIRHAEQDCHDAALEHAQEAERYYRALQDQQDKYRPDRAACLNNLGTWLVELDRHEEALPLLQEAVDTYWDLVEADRGYIGRLAEALTNLSLCRRPVEPLPQLEAAVEHYRGRAESEPDHYLPDLAHALHALGDRHLRQHRYDDALPVLDEALGYYISLALANPPKRYLPDLAACCNNLGVNLSELGRHAEAVERARQAVQMNRELTQDSPRRHQPELARSLDNLVIFLSRMGQHAEAIPHAEEAVSLHRQLAEILPHRFRPELARALTNLGVSLSERRRHAEALAVALEAETICRDLAKRDASRYWPHLARALDNLAVDYSALRRDDKADFCRHEAHRIRMRHGCASPVRRRWPRRDRLPRGGALPGD